MRAEFQAVVMALGKGSRMTDLTNHCPKPLLPVGNYPMIWYPLHTLESTGFDEAIVITSEGTKPRLQKELAGKLKIRLDLVEIPDEEWGTAESLAYVAAKIRMDILVISCDLIIMDLDLYAFADLHRIKDSTLTALFAPIVPETKLAPPGSKSKSTLEHDFIGVSPDSQLIFVHSEADLNENISVRKNTLERHPNITVYSKLMDAHLYLLKRSALDFLMEHKNISSIKGELVPLLIEEQFKSTKSSRQEAAECHLGPPCSVPNAVGPNTANVELDEKDIMKLLNESSSVVNTTLLPGNSVGCYGCIYDIGYCLRANTLASYFEANKKVLQTTSSASSRIDQSIKNQNGKVDRNSFVGANSCLGEKAVIIKSVIGQNCEIRSNAKINNCVIMNSVTVGNGCSLEGCIIAEDAAIGEGCRLKDCLITARVNVDPSVKLTKELISDTHQMMEIE